MQGHPRRLAVASWSISETGRVRCEGGSCCVERKWKRKRELKVEGDFKRAKCGDEKQAGT